MKFKFGFALLVISLLAGCSTLQSVKKRFNINTDAPNEFEIETREKLVIPKDLNSLPIPIDPKNSNEVKTDIPAPKDKLEQEILQETGKGQDKIDPILPEIKDTHERKKLMDYHLGQ